MLANFRGDLRIGFTLAVTDFRRRYAGAMFGVAWSLIQPMVTILVLWFVFQAGLRTETVEGQPFLIWLVCGIVPWFFFAEAVSGASNSLVEYNYLVKKVVFKVQLLPVAKLIAASFIHVIFLLLTLTLLGWFHRMPGLPVIQLVYYFFAAGAAVFAVTSVTVSIIPFFRDLSQLIMIALQFGMWVTPIMWSDARLPEQFKWILFVNPMTYIVEGYRDAILRGVWFWEKPNQTLYFWCVVALISWIGISLFKRLRPHFADAL